MKRQCLILYVTLLASAALSAQPPESVQSNAILDAYIQEGLQSNESLRQLQLDYAISLGVLKEAKGLFFPDLSVNARYTIAEGGRVIEFPVGDLLNPIYSTLNMLTMSEQFPQIENQQFNFYRDREHETKLRLIQPIFQPDLINNYRIRKQGVELSRISIDQYKKELVKEISLAYYNYQKAKELVSLADTTMRLVTENLRVSKSLFANDKVTVDVVYRSEAEIGKVKAEKAKAVNLEQSSKAYFNFLLNRDLTREIELAQFDSPLNIIVENVSDKALENRDELRQIEAYQELVRRKTSLYKGANLPGVYAVVDYGFQGEKYRFTRDDDFLLASLVLEWKLFKGRVNRQKVKQSRIEEEKLASLQEQTKQKIQLDVINSYYALEAAREAVEAARDQLHSSKKAYRAMEKKFKEGQCNLLELTDARTNLTSAGTSLILSRSDYFSAKANYEYAVGMNYTDKP